MNKLCPMPGCRVEQITRDDPGILHIATRSTRPGGRCPDCGHASRTVHSRYRRRPADLPALGRAVRLDLRLRRFYCRNTACTRRTFAERLPELIRPHARRTGRLAQAQARVGVALGGKGSARLLQHLAIPASADTVLRLVRRLPLPEPEPPRAVGVDDWALRKGRTYGSIVVDPDRRCVLHLLPDRTPETLAAWLRGQPQIAVVARDRSTEYARGIGLGAPGATQVADRWHVLVNLRQAVERWLAGAHARLRRLPPSPGTPTDTQPARRTKPFARTRAERAARVGRRERWVALYEEVRRRHAAGEALQAISRAMNLAVGTVRKYAAAESFPVPEGRPLRRSILDPYLAHLQARLAEGCENALALWRELRAAGFLGTAKQVQRWVAEHRTAPAPSPPHRWRTKAPAHTPMSAAQDSAPALPSPSQLAWLLVQPPSALSGPDAALVARVEQDPTAARVAGLARRLTALVRGCGVNPKVDPEAARMALNAWLATPERRGS